MLLHESNALFIDFFNLFLWLFSSFFSDRLRAMFGTDIMKNAVHGASTKEGAIEKIQMIFGDIEFNEDGTVKGR